MDKSVFLFDLDGTVIDSKIGIFNSIDYMFQKLNMPIPDEAIKVKFIGPSIGASLIRLFGFSPEASAAAVAIYREYYSTTGIMEFELYDGIPELVRELKSRNFKVAIATKKPEMFATRIVESVGIPFDLVFGSEPTDHDESKAHIIKRAATALSEKTDLGDVLMIGDSHYDIAGANSVGVESVGVGYGYGSRDEFLQNHATHICDTVSDLQNLLLEL